MRERLAVACVILSLAIGCATRPDPPPVLVETGPSSQLSGRLLPWFATDTALYFSSAGFAETANDGLYRVELSDASMSLVVAGRVHHVHEHAGQLIAVMDIPGESMRQLVRIDLNGSAPQLEPVDNNAVAAASTDDYTFVLSELTGSSSFTRIIRLATDSEPALQVLDYQFAPEYQTPLVATADYLYWEHANGVQRIAADGSEVDAEPTWLYGPSTTSIPVEGQSSEITKTLVGVIGDKVYGAVYITSFFATGGEWSNGDPKGYYDYGGGALMQIGPRDFPDPAPDGRLVRTDIRIVAVAGDVVYGQDRDGTMLRIDPATGESTALQGFPQKLAGGNTNVHFGERLVANTHTLFYSYAREAERHYAIHAQSLTGDATGQ